MLGSLTKKHYIIFIVSITCIVFIFHQFRKSNGVILQNIIDKNEFKDALNKITSGFDNKYPDKCIDLFKKLRYPNTSLIIRPPPKKPPADMMNDFTMNGKMPITSYLYFNEAYSDSNSDNKSVITETISQTFHDQLKKVRNKQGLNYGDKVLNQIMHSYADKIKNKFVVVIGTQVPWIEAIAYDIGASFITTLDYNRKRYILSNLKWVHVNDFLDEQIENKRIEQFDIAASFSSIEHSGLGRYGDPLSPYGDVDAVKQVHCMLKPGGLFFLSLPASHDGSSRIEYNAHRVYGKVRLELLFKGWELLETKRDSSGIHNIFVLKKI